MKAIYVDAYNPNRFLMQVTQDHRGGTSRIWDGRTLHEEEPTDRLVRMAGDWEPCNLSPEDEAALLKKIKSALPKTPE